MPITFPKSVDDLPRNEIPGTDLYDPDFSGAPPTADTRLMIDYRIERPHLGFTIRNTGERAGADVPQVYLLARDCRPVQRLVGF